MVSDRVDGFVGALAKAHRLCRSAVRYCRADFAPQTVSASKHGHLREV